VEGMVVGEVGWSTLEWVPRARSSGWLRWRGCCV
jgi:hypothetical protein